jgi:molecular chaperone DnaK
MPMGRLIGIDLGTTFSAAAAVGTSGNPSIVPNREGDRLTPSVVLFQGDVTLVGAQAVNAAAIAPGEVASHVKRHMGEPGWRFDTERGHTYTSEQISGILLRRIKEDAELVLGEEVSGAVITVPAYFDDARRTATKDAGEIAGLEVPRIINEPTAAALSYGLATGFTGTALVYDLGGGTFDVSLLQIAADKGDFTTLDSQGDRGLGGFNWDNEMMRLLSRKVVEQGGPDVDELSDGREIAALREQAERAKEQLSNVPQATVVLSLQGTHTTVRISRDEFEEETRPLVQRTAETIEDVLDDQGHSPNDIDRLLLVGGSTRMPMIADLLQRMFGSAPERAVNPDEAVALGAAVQAEIVSHELVAPDSIPLSTACEAAPDVTLQDITSQSLGVIIREHDTQRHINSPIIPRATQVPTKQSGHYQTMTDNQTALDIPITEGEGEDVRYVQVVHNAEFPIPPYPRGAPIEVIMSYDIDAMIHIEVVDRTRDETLGEVELDRPANLERAEVEAQAQTVQELEVY